jgi:enoyl-CoA hydratase/carnithine racemase
VSGVRDDEPAAGVLRLTIDRPERRNALDLEVLGALAAAVRGSSAACIVIRGAAPAFSAGYDLRALPASGSEEFAAAADALIANPDHDVFAAIEAQSATVVAAIDGPALGGGLELAIACDLRLASSRARLGMPARDLGLVYSHSGVQRFLDTCGAALTKELFLGGRIFEGEAARLAGLVGAVAAPAELDGLALDLARRIAAAPPLAVGGNKRLIDGCRRAGGSEEQLRSLRRRSLGSEELRRRVGAFVARTGSERPC